MMYGSCGKRKGKRRGVRFPISRSQNSSDTARSGQREAWEIT